MSSNLPSAVSAGPIGFKLQLGEVSEPLKPIVMQAVKDISGVSDVTVVEDGKRVVLEVFISDRHQATFVRGRVVSHVKDIFRLGSRY